MTQPSMRFALQLELRQARLVAEALGHQPYVRVHALVARLQAWAGTGEASFVLARDELVLIIDALGDLPYRRVHALIGSLRHQLAAVAALHVA